MQLLRPTPARLRTLPHRTLTRLLAVLAAFGLGGCAFQPHADPSRFFVLTGPGAAPEPDSGGGSKRWNVGLRPVEIPAYLRTRFMVVRRGTNEIDFADFDRWAEPLDEGIGRVLKEKLGAAGNVAGVTLNSQGGDSLDYEVALQILACEGVRAENGASSVRFSATWEVRAMGTNDPAIKRGGFNADFAGWDGKDFGQLALRLSAAVADAGKALAADLGTLARPAGTSGVH